VLTRCGLPLPVYFLADEQPSRCLNEKVYLPTIVHGRVIWPLGSTVEASAAAFTQSCGGFQRAAAQQEPSYRVKGVLTDGFDSTTKSMRPLFPGVRVGNCLRHALLKLPKKLAAIASPVRYFRHQNAFEQAEMILLAALDPTIASRARRGEFVTCFDPFDFLQTAIN
jgi:hypothetical protein